VDTHVWQIAQRDYKFGGKKSKTFNKAMYDAVGDHFRGIWGTYAGWAHSVLFTADLREFANQVTKKEETLKVEIKEEAVTENILQTTSRKRRTVTETRVKSEVKLEEGGGGPVTIVERTTKKRRTRAS
jgi:N-glycosylase/DNA lyase